MSSEPSPPRERDDRERSRLERIVPELVKKLLEVGAEKLADGPENLRQLLADLKLPREAILLLTSQVDETKKELTRVLARELREFLERSSLADELTKLLSGLTLEVKTQIRFVPNATTFGRPRPEVKSDVSVRVESEQPAEEAASVREESRTRPEPPRQASPLPRSADQNMAEQERTK